MDDDKVNATSQSKSYVLSGKIMLCSVIILFVVVVFMLILHIYIRFRILRRQRRSALRFSPNPSRPNARRGLDPKILNSIPIFECKPEMALQADCAVCLCEFEEKEKGRTLPECKHSFHVECIDMWFSSHDNCPLCRAPIALVQPELTQLASSSSSSLSSSGNEMRIEIPHRSGVEDPKSPLGRMLSFKRMLTFNRGGVGSSGDIERGEGVDRVDSYTDQHNSNTLR